MAIDFNPGIGQIKANANAPAVKVNQTHDANVKKDFAQNVLNSLREVNDVQNQADASIVDLLSGNNQDINSVVASVAKADMSFKLLVGVRNKLVEAYKETMKMQI